MAKAYRLFRYTSNVISAVDFVQCMVYGSDHHFLRSMASPTRFAAGCELAVFLVGSQDENRYNSCIKRSTEHHETCHEACWMRAKKSRLSQQHCPQRLPNRVPPGEYEWEHGHRPPDTPALTTVCSWEPATQKSLAFAVQKSLTFEYNNKTATQNRLFRR